MARRLDWARDKAARRRADSRALVSYYIVAHDARREHEREQHKYLRIAERHASWSGFCASVARQRSAVTPKQAAVLLKIDGSAQIVE